MTCRLVQQDKGARAWFRCDGCGFVWLGTYAMPKHRRAKAQAEHLQHRARCEP